MRYDSYDQEQEGKIDDYNSISFYQVLFSLQTK